ncbi:MAG: hypothetical protein WAM14_04895 [Candidatus Nitrosopolaris sp.]
MKRLVKAVTSENPELRYIIGNDAVRILEAKKLCPILSLEI